MIFSFKVISINSEKAIESLLLFKSNYVQDTVSTILHEHLFFSCDIHEYILTEDQRIALEQLKIRLRGNQSKAV